MITVNPGAASNRLPVVTVELPNGQHLPVYAHADEAGNLITQNNPLPIKIMDPKNFILEIRKGNIPGHRIIEINGYAADITDGIVPVTTNKVFKTPTTAVALEFVSDSASDTINGVGARKIQYTGILDGTWEEVTNTIETNGITGVPLPDNIVRLLDFRVIESGAYGDPFTASYAGNLSIREVDTPVEIWGNILAIAPFAAVGEIGVTTIPAGERAYLISKHINVESGKIANIYVLSRENTNDTTPPFTGVRQMVERDIGISGSTSVVFEELKGPFYGPCDIGFMANVPSNTANIAVEMAMLLVEDGY